MCHVDGGVYMSTPSLLGVPILLMMWHFWWSRLFILSFVAFLYSSEFVMCFISRKGQKWNSFNRPCGLATVNWSSQRGVVGSHAYAKDSEKLMGWLGHSDCWGLECCRSNPNHLGSSFVHLIAIHRLSLCSIYRPHAYCVKTSGIH